jgi:hypothetical protein
VSSSSGQAAGNVSSHEKKKTHRTVLVESLLKTRGLWHRLNHEQKIGKFKASSEALTGLNQSTILATTFATANHISYDMVAPLVRFEKIANDRKDQPTHYWQ